MSHDTYTKVKNVVADCIPAVVEMVKDGTLSINAAAKLANLTESQQEKLAAGGVKAVVEAGILPKSRTWSAFARRRFASRNFRVSGARS